MPERVVAVNPQGASVSSGGETTSAKLQSYIDRLTAKSNEATQHLLAYINVSEHTPAPHYFPELQIEYLRDRMALVAERTEGMLEVLIAQREARLRVEQDLEPPPCASCLGPEHSHQESGEEALQYSHEPPGGRIRARG